ncbi:MAG: hypothetical protein K2J32_06765 [Ruminococcus sp.]|nr:hypothetical protein [Ruminococcus sp.]
MNIRIIFLNNLTEETDYIIAELPFDFGDYLENCDVAYEQDGEDNFWVLDESRNRTGEVFTVLSAEECMDEELVW